MNFHPKDFVVTEFNIDGFIKLSKKTDSYILQKNTIEFDTQWQVAINADFTLLIINSSYQPESKLDFSKFASYKTTKSFEFTEIQNLENEKEILMSVTKSFYLELANEYNNRLKDTKIEVPFPKTSEQELDRFSERLRVSLHKALERTKKLL